VAIFIDGYEIDVTTSEEHLYDSEITADPVALDTLSMFALIWSSVPRPPLAVILSRTSDLAKS